MHELSIAQSIIEVAVEEATRAGAQRIERVKLRVGALSGVVPEALEFAFTVAKQGTIAENAQLEVEYLPVVCRCPNCGVDFEAEGYICACPRCGRLVGEIRQGQELEIEYLEVS